MLGGRGEEGCDMLGAGEGRVSEGSGEVRGKQEETTGRVSMGT